MNDIANINLPGDVVSQVDAIESPNDSEIEEAVRRLVEAAEEARKNEGPGVDGQQEGQSLSSWVDSVDGAYDWIPERFEKFYDRWPAFTRGMAMNLDDAKEPLKSGPMSDLNPVDTAVARWSGDSQRAFYENFLSPFPGAVTNHQALFAELQAGLYAYEAVVRSMRAAAKQIAEETIKVLDGMNSGFFGSSDEEVKFGLAVVAAAAGVIAAAGTGGVAIGLAIVAGGGSVATYGIDWANAEDETTKHHIHGGTVQDILESMQTALNTLWDDVQKAERGIAALFEASLDEVNGHLTSSSSRNKRTLLPHEPDDGVPNLTDGDDISIAPQDDEFRVRD